MSDGTSWIWTLGAWFNIFKLSNTVWRICSRYCINSYKDNGFMFMWFIARMFSTEKQHFKYKECIYTLTLILQTLYMILTLLHVSVGCCLTCLEFWFSILVLTSGCSVKSGAKYSKYSAEDRNKSRTTKVEMIFCLKWFPLNSYIKTHALAHKCKMSYHCFPTDGATAWQSLLSNSTGVPVFFLTHKNRTSM